MKNSDKTIRDYLKQVSTGIYKELTEELFDSISEEGWVYSLEDDFGKLHLKRNDFEFLGLALSKEDKEGLISFKDEIVEKFNSFDIQLKDKQKYPFKTLDFIDYNKGIVYIIHLKLI